MTNKTSSYHGVSKSFKSPQGWVYRVQVAFAGRTFYVSDYHNGHSFFLHEEKAAQAYDNLAFYANLDLEHYPRKMRERRKLPLNFPKDYSGETYPEKTSATEKVLLKVINAYEEQEVKEGERYKSRDIPGVLRRLEASREQLKEATRDIQDCLDILASLAGEPSPADGSLTNGKCANSQCVDVDKGPSV